MDRRTALVVENDADIAELISIVLTRAGIQVTVCDQGADAFRLLAELQPELVTLDLSLPDMDGLEVCRRIRALSDCYIVMVTARTEEIDMLIGLEVGADDYIRKPFSPRELQARVAALFRRPRAELAGAPLPPRPMTDDVIDGGEGLVLDRHGREVSIHGSAVQLTRTEFDLLSHLASRPGVVVPRKDLLREVWSTDFDGATHVVDVHVGNLRRKLRTVATTPWIRTVRGVGFRFDPA